MACQFEVYFNAGQYLHDTATAIEVLDEIDRLESQLSIYREESEISQLNRCAADGPVAVEPGLFSLFSLAMELSAASDGAYDITAGPLSHAWGFFRRAGEMPTPEVLLEAQARVGWRHVRLNEADCSVQFMRPVMELNVNSLGKGYALDCCAARLEEQGINDFLFHGGQSSMLARGARGDRTDGWTVGLRHPLRKSEPLAEFVLQDAALGTSGNAAQSFVYRGKRYGHILDPRSGEPACGVYSASVVAPTAALADALATACYVLGGESAIELCKQFHGVGCLLVVPGKRVNSIEILQHGIDSLTILDG
ncbi:MAG: FAD:protein FMN transferase [Planctomycetales bacterium]|nr:FAD:protein FMN transferase [Planctomycetales bacterium]